MCPCWNEYCCACKCPFDNRGAGNTYFKYKRWHNLCPSCSE